MEYIANDMDLPDFIMETTDYLNIRKSFIVDLVMSRTSLIKLKLNMIRAPYDSSAQKFKYNPSNVSLKYKCMVGYENFLKTMKRLKKIKETNNLEFIILITHDVPAGMASRISTVCSQSGFYALYMMQNIQDPSLILSREDTHPSGLEHKLIAEDLFNFMIKEKIIERCVKK